MPDKDMLLLDPVTGKPTCRKEVSTLVDQSSIIGNSDTATPFRVNYQVVAGALAGSGVAANAGKLDAALVHNATGTTANATSGAGTSTSPVAVRQATDALTGVVELTGSAQMPAEKTRDDSALTPAGAGKLLRYIKPVASTGALNAEQTSADAIEVPMLSNFSCTGGVGGSPKFDVPLAGGGSCTVDIGQWGSNLGVIAPGTLVASGVKGCFRLPEAGLYRITWDFDPSESIMYVYNAGYNAAHPSPCLSLFTLNQADCNLSYASGAIDLKDDTIVSTSRASNWLGSIGECSSAAITYNGSVAGVIGGTMGAIPGISIYKA